MKCFIIRSLFFTTTVFAAIINVPTGQPTIQAGIDAASSGDTILVDPGTYYENIIWPATNGIKLSGSGEEDCIINGGNLGTTIKFYNEISGIIDTTTLITGFAINGGPSYAGGGIYCHTASPTFKDVTISDGWGDVGGGMYCYNSSPTLVNVTISGNGANIGGGMYCYNSNPMLIDVVIHENHAGVSGGGIYCYNSSPTLVNVTVDSNTAHYEGGGIFYYSGSPTLTNVTIRDNRMSSPSGSGGSSGGGICFYNSSSELTNVTIERNSVTSAWGEAYGGGIYCSGSDLVLTGVTISDNSADAQGGGVYCNGCSASLDKVTITSNSAGEGGGIACSNSSLTLTEGTIANNLAFWNGGGFFFSACNANLKSVLITGNSTAGDGGGIYCYYDSSPTLVNCILWNDLPQEVYFHENGNPNSIVIAYSDIQSGEAGIITNDSGIVYWEDGNIDTDPLFIDPDNSNFNLQANSPCIDAGTAFFVWEGDTLVNMSENEYDGNAPDLGSFESPYTISVEYVPQLPKTFTLYQNYPNPFNPVTTLRYDFPKNSFVRITVYDMLGRQVRTLINQTQEAGYKSVIWDGTNDNGKPVSAGVFLYKIQAGKFTQTKKMIMLR